MPLDTTWQDPSLIQPAELTRVLRGATDSPCPRCGRGYALEELGSVSSVFGSFWLHCSVCGHLWRQLHPGADAFALILANAPATSTSIPQLGECPLGRVPRAPRFRVHLEVRYWIAGDVDWRIGLTHDISRSGVLFGVHSAVGPKTPVKMILTLPGSVAGEPPGRVRCHGHTVRGVWPAVPGGRPAIAATVGEYRLLTS